MSAPLRKSTTWAIAICLVAWTSTASATPDFPAVVVKTLSLTAITIDAPQGCQLCHTSEAGGTSMRAFGTLLLQYGAEPYQEASLQAALGEVQQNDPQLVADIKEGRDPNTDDSAASNVHAPEYGCGVARAPSEPNAAWMALGALGALWIRRKRGETRRRRRPSARA